MKNKWSIQDSIDLYNISRWGSGYFSVNKKGNLTCSGLGSEAEIDFKELVEDLRKRGIELPILIRFNDILKSRIKVISESFYKSIKQYGYKGNYQGVVPIKVNQQRHVVEELIDHGQPYNLGLEAGSKPELLLAIALMKGDKSMLICNGYKDVEYIETALYAQQIGLNTVIVLDRFAELETIIKTAKELNISPQIGVRAKLSTKGAGKWEESSGDLSKFGLTASEIVLVVKKLAQENMLDCLKLLHFHIGSQITSIRSIKEAVREAAYLYCNLKKLGCSDLKYVDTGGGLAVDYDGSKTNFHSSMNYSNQEYANDIVATLMDVCDENSQQHPNIVTESGRALVAHHSVLIFNTVGTYDPTAVENKSMQKPSDDKHNIVHSMWDSYQSVNTKNCQEIYNDIVAAKEESITLFSHGVVDLQTKAYIDDLFWLTCKKILKLMKSLPFVPEDLKDLPTELSKIYYCNFSVFQSMPDSWAVGQLFPIAPIHRLSEQPIHEATLADLTCDSDGKINKFVDLRDVKSTIRLHSPNGKPYYLGAFLVGAYQEILGDLHNLFGDTNVVHVSLDENSNYHLDHVVQGDSVSEVISYVEYNRDELIKSVRKKAEAALRKGHISLENIAHFIKYYKAGLDGYTYLENFD